MSGIRRLDHVGIAVHDTARALRYFVDHLGLRAAHSEEIPVPPVRLTYLDAGNAWLQLVEPLDDDSVIAVHLREHGEGVHHVCFGVDDVLGSAAALAEDPAAPAPVPGSGRGRRSAFVRGRAHGVQLECTEFDRRADVDDTAGWLPWNTPRGPSDGRGDVSRSASGASAGPAHTADVSMVGVIGLGVMGGAMAANLLDAGHEVVVHSRSPGPVEAARARGAVAADGPAEVGRMCAVVVTALPDSAAVEQVVLGHDGVFAAAEPGLLLIDTSTIEPATARAVDARASSGTGRSTRR